MKATPTLRGGAREIRRSGCAPPLNPSAEPGPDQAAVAREVSAWWGHGSVSFTLDTYTHLFPVDDDYRDRLDADFLAAETAISNLRVLPC